MDVSCLADIWRTKSGNFVFMLSHWARDSDSLDTIESTAAAGAPRNREFFMIRA